MRRAAATIAVIATLATAGVGWRAYRAAALREQAADLLTSYMAGELRLLGAPQDVLALASVEPARYDLEGVENGHAWRAACARLPPEWARECPIHWRLVPRDGGASAPSTDPADYARIPMEAP